jgi:hypothetical protein
MANPNHKIPRPTATIGHSLIRVTCVFNQWLTYSPRWPSFKLDARQNLSVSAPLQ